MEALPLARMAREFLPELDGNVGVSKRRDEAMPQAVKAPSGHVAPCAAVSAFRAIPAATPARSIMRRKAMLAPELPGTEDFEREGNSGASSLAPAGCLRRKASISRWIGKASFFPSLAVFEGVKVIAPHGKSTLPHFKRSASPSLIPANAPSRMTPRQSFEGAACRSLAISSGVKVSFCALSSCVERRSTARAGFVAMYPILTAAPRAAAIVLCRQVRRNG